MPTDEWEEPGASSGAASPRSFRACIPFEAGSVSIRLYPHNELPADLIVSEICAQAGLDKIAPLLQ